MIKFDLERALAGDKVVDSCGCEVLNLTQLYLTKEKDCYQLIGACGGLVAFYDRTNLFMAPKKLSGFVNIYDNDSCTYNVHSDRRTADKLAGSKRTACINLSQFEEGYGL